MNAAPSSGIDRYPIDTGWYVPRCETSGRRGGVRADPASRRAWCPRGSIVPGERAAGPAGGTAPGQRRAERLPSGWTPRPISGHPRCRARGGPDETRNTGFTRRPVRDVEAGSQGTTKSGCRTTRASSATSRIAPTISRRSRTRATRSRRRRRREGQRGPLRAEAGHPRDRKPERKRRHDDDRRQDGSCGPSPARRQHREAVQGEGISRVALGRQQVEQMDQAVGREHDRGQHAQHLGHRTRHLPPGPRVPGAGHADQCRTTNRTPAGAPSRSAPAATYSSLRGAVPHPRPARAARRDDGGGHRRVLGHHPAASALRRGLRAQPVWAPGCSPPPTRSAPSRSLFRPAWLVSRVGPKRVTLLALALMGLASLGFAFATVAPLLALARLAQGAGAAGVWAAALAWAIAVAPPGRRSEVIGTVTGAAIIGAVGGPALGVLGDWFGVRTLFAVFVAVPVALGLLVARRPAPPSRHARRRPGGDARRRSRRARAHRGMADGPARGGLRRDRATGAAEALGPRLAGERDRRACSWSRRWSRRSPRRWRGAPRTGTGPSRRRGSRSPSPGSGSRCWRRGGPRW